MRKTDVAVIGAGVLGCFAARALSAYMLDTVVLEQREDVCTGISRANTGIVYTGYDTKPGTLKTALCVRANKSFDRLCAELDVPFQRRGSLMVAYGERGERVVRKKYADGLENGVEGLRLLSGAEVSALEPNLAPGARLGLYAPGTGTVNPWELGIAAYENAAANGAEFRFSEAVMNISRVHSGFAVETEKESYFAKAVVNCAGLASGRVREFCESPMVRVFPSAADYLVTDTTAGDFVRHVVFHEPERKGKGLTLVPTVDGNLLIGPTERDQGESPPGATDAEGLDALRRLCAEIVPGLPLDSVIRSFGALRPNPYHVHFDNGAYAREDRGISNFTIMEESGLFSLIGIKTPGLTCASELGGYLAGRIAAYLGGAEKNQAFSPARKGIARPRGMAEGERARFVAENPEYGRILCRCRGVSAGEVREAVRRGASTIDGVKRRAGAGMGRCQGGYCMQRVLELLSKETGLPPQRVTKDGAGTEVVYGNL